MTNVIGCLFLSCMFTTTDKGTAFLFKGTMLFVRYAEILYYHDFIPIKKYRHKLLLTVVLR